jgi:uncharacterized lipoprotein YbaY
VEAIAERERVTVSGRIEFGPEGARLREATVHVWIEDTTYADVPAVRLAEQRMLDVFYNGEPDGIPFTLEWDDEGSRTPGHTYVVAAFVDVDRDGRPGQGDYVCHQAVPVPRPGTAARVRVKRIG